MIYLYFPCAVLWVEKWSKKEKVIVKEIIKKGQWTKVVIHSLSTMVTGKIQASILYLQNQSYSSQKKETCFREYLMWWSVSIICHHVWHCFWSFIVQMSQQWSKVGVTFCVVGANCHISKVTMATLTTMCMSSCQPWHKEN